MRSANAERGVGNAERRIWRPFVGRLTCRRRGGLQSRGLQDRRLQDGQRRIEQSWPSGTTAATSDNPHSAISNPQFENPKSRIQNPKSLRSLRPDAHRGEEEVFEGGGFVQIEPQQADVVFEFVDRRREHPPGVLIAGGQRRERKGARGLLDLGKQTGTEAVGDAGFDRDLLIVVEIGG